jgi:hypothetical protein
MWLFHPVHVAGKYFGDLVAIKKQTRGSSVSDFTECVRKSFILGGGIDDLWV